MYSSSPLNRQRGITLIESLVALLVTALGILGIVGVQMRTLVDSQTTVRRAQAIRLIEDLGERMKVNPNALLTMTDYVSGYAEKDTDLSATDCLTQACLPDQQVGFDLKQWKATVRQTLPAGQASLFLAPGETVTANRRQLGVMIAWRENERADLSADDKALLDASKGGTNTANACPTGFTCHLQYLTVSARCAPYGASGTAVAVCI